MSSEPTGSALFGAFAQPIGASPWPTVEMMLKARPICRVLASIKGEVIEPVEVDLIYALAAGGPSLIPDRVMGHLVAAVDSGAAIALHGTQDDAITAAIEQVMVLAGGGRS